MMWSEKKWYDMIKDTFSGILAFHAMSTVFRALSLHSDIFIVLAENLSLRQK